MKISTLFIALIAVSSALSNSCSSTDKALRQQQKALQTRVDSAQAVAAHRALADRNFLLPVDNLTFLHGGTFTVNSTICFLSMQGDKGVIQIASPVANPGPNGIGGFTLEGTVSNLRHNVSKKGDTVMSYRISGKGLTADVSISLPHGTTRASATVEPGYGPGAMRIDGRISPYEPNNVVSGTPF